MRNLSLKNKLGGILLIVFCFVIFSADTNAQTTIFTETVGTPASTTAINSYTGWSNPSYTFTGSGDVRTSLPSTGYTGASGSGNVFLTNSGGINFQIAGVDTTGFSSLTLSFGIYKNTTAGTGSDLIVEVSSDGTTYTPLTFTALPSGTGTTGWYLRTATGMIPATANLRIRFTNSGTVTQYRIDDVKLVGTGATAAGAMINGRITDSRGRGLQRVVVMMMGSGIEEPIYATTSAFGYYRFEDVPAGNSYILTASSIRYTFEQPTIVINVNGDLDGADFVGQRRFSGLTDVRKAAKP